MFTSLRTMLGLGSAKSADRPTLENVCASIRLPAPTETTGSTTTAGSTTPASQSVPSDTPSPALKQPVESGLEFTQTTPQVSSTRSQDAWDETSWAANLRSKYGIANPMDMEVS